MSYVVIVMKPFNCLCSFPRDGLSAMTEETRLPRFWNQRFSFSEDNCWQRYRAHPARRLVLRWQIYPHFALSCWFETVPPREDQESVWRLEAICCASPSGIFCRYWTLSVSSPLDQHQQTSLRLSTWENDILDCYYYYFYYYYYYYYFSRAIQSLSTDIMI